MLLYILFWVYLKASPQNLTGCYEALKAISLWFRVFYRLMIRDFKPTTNSGKGNFRHWLGRST